MVKTAKTMISGDQGRCLRTQTPAPYDMGGRHSICVQINQGPKFIDFSDEIVLMSCEPRTGVYTSIFVAGRF